MYGIAWGEFSWESFSTLAAGGGAILGAVIVGIRQTKILDRQVNLERMKLRVELFDRRIVVYEATIKWLQEFWRKGDAPEGAVQTEFVWAIEKSKFLFRPEISTTLSDWLVKARQHSVLKAAGDYEKADPLGRVLWDAGNRVNNMFVNEMRVSDTDLPLPIIDPHQYREDGAA